MKKLLFGIMLVLGACGDDVSDPTELQRLQKQVDILQIQADSLGTLINSDFATCPASGDTADALVRKMCQVAQASTVEAKIELKGQLASYATALQNQITAINVDLNSSAANIAVLQAQVTNMLSDIATLQGQMTTANNAILALQNLTASITGTLNGTMVSLDIGSENLSSGPVYESVLKRVDSKRFNGYVQAYGTTQVLPSAPVTAVNASATVTVTLTAHGYVAGDVVALEGLTGARGITSGQLTQEFAVVTAVANSFTIVVSTAATSGGTLGGANGTVRKVIGRGMSTLWKSSDPNDVAVRVSNLGSKRYNFIIRRKASDVTNATGELCYDKTNNAATFATINAAAENGSGNIACK